MNIFSRLFKKKQDPVNDALKLIFRIIEDEDYQNDMYDEYFKNLLINGLSCDQVPNATGFLGFDLSSPIPVNGAVGEIAYLSKLETNNNERLLFHRIGAANKIDVFEAVTFYSNTWYIFYLDMYHPRKSRLAPSGFKLSEKLKQFSGFHNYCDNFPYDFPEKKQEQRSLGLSIAYISLDNIMGQLKNGIYNRPQNHTARLNEIRSMLTSISC